MSNTSAEPQEPTELEIAYAIGLLRRQARDELATHLHDVSLAGSTEKLQAYLHALRHARFVLVRRPDTL